MRKLVLIICVSLCVPYSALTAQEKQHPLRERLLKDLNLNDEQKQALKRFKKQRSQSREKMQEVFSLRKSLMQSLKNPDSSEDEILGKAKALNKAQQKALMQRVNSMLSLKRELEPGQLKTLMARIQEMRSKFAEQVGNEKIREMKQAIRSGKMSPRELQEHRKRFRQRMQRENRSMKQD